MLETAERGEQPGPPVRREGGALRFTIGTQILRGIRE